MRRLEAGELAAELATEMKEDYQRMAEGVSEAEALRQARSRHSCDAETRRTSRQLSDRIRGLPGFKL
jgi:hypothetical protein